MNNLMHIPFQSIVLCVKTWVVICFLIIPIHSKAQHKNILKNTIDKGHQRPTKKIIQIKNNLNNFKISKALKEIQDLIDDDPYSTYNTELQVNVLKQIIDKIIFIKDENNANTQTSYLDAMGKEMPDTLEREIESDSIMLRFVTNPNDEVDEADLIIVKSLDSLGADIKTAKKKKKKWFQYDAEDSENSSAESASLIDSSVIKKTLSKAANENESSEISAADLDKEAVAADDGILTAGYSKSKSKQEKMMERMEEIRIGYSQMDEKFYKAKLIQQARLSTLWVEYADSASRFLREYLIDTLLAKQTYKDSALHFIETGDEHLENKEYEEALTDYNAAMIIEPMMLPIYWRMGDAYMLLGEDSMGNEFFKSALLLDSTTPNTIFHIAQFYYNKGNYQKALEKAAEAMLFYPDKIFFEMIKNISDKTASDYVSQWIPRLVFPISPKNKTEEWLADEKNPWFDYQSAKMNFVIYADENGIMRFNEKTPERYLEVACFLNMLDGNKEVKELKFARDMRKIGYLDCYTLISLFHVDLYPQFKDLAQHNPEKIKKYFAMLLNWDKHKYDEVRKEKPVIEEKKKQKK